VTLRVVDTGHVVADFPMNTFVLYDDRLVTAELFSGEVTLWGSNTRCRDDLRSLQAVGRG
jgi:hypothetical protein